MKIARKFNQQHLNTQIILIVSVTVTILVGTYLSWSTYSDYKLELKSLNNSTSMLAKELIATRLFLADKQDRINTDQNGNTYFKHLNPSAAVRGISEIFNKSSGYTFKQTRLEIRNPANAPDAYEKQILKKFLNDRKLTEYASVNTNNGKEYYRYMVPLYYDKSCLSCHGEPKGAVDISGYPKEGAHEGDFAGAISITAPLNATFKSLAMKRTYDIVSMLILLLALITAIYFAIRSKVIKPLEDIANSAERFGKELALIEPPEAKNYEIGVLQNALYNMALNLRDLYENMESKIGERTQELREANQTLKSYQNDLQAINKELENALDVKSEFIALMSHELQTPLTSIIAYSEILIHEGADVPESSEYLLNIYQSAHHLLDLITDILDFSKIEKGKMKLHLTYFTLDEIFKIMVNIFSPITEQNELEFTVAIPPDLPMIKADKNKIKQVIMNLLSNAIKFTPAGGSIHVEVSYLQVYEAFQISISDTGRGIEPEKLNQIFDRFVQIDSSPSREFGGLGLGLAVSKQMIELHGGNIWAESTVNKGSTFHFTLPCITGQNP